MRNSHPAQTPSRPAAARKLWLALPASLLFSALCFAQTSAIQGDVKGEDGKPLVGAVIKIERTDIKQTLNTKTDKKGHYFYGGLQAGGTFNVTLEMGGKTVDAATGIKPAGVTDVNFDLKAQAAKANNPEEVEKGMSPAQKAEFEKKKKDAEAAIAKNKELNDAFNAGMEAQDAKKYDVAIEQFEKGAMLAPMQHVIWSHLADSYGDRAATNEPEDMKKADLDKAIADYKTAIEIEGREATYHNNYALILVRAKKLDEAKEELNKAATLDPSSAGKYYYNLGAVMANTNQTDAASEAFKKSADAGYSEAYYQYGLVLMGKATQAPDGKILAAPGTVEAFQKYLQMAPTGPNAEAAKQLLATLGSGVQTSVDNKKKK